MAFLNSNLSTTLATAGTALLSLSFVFATTAQEILGSCIFLFVKHPYDVGDRVDINSSQLTVEHIALLYSVFKRVDTHKVVQIPHVVLNSGWVENVSRSRAMREQINVYVNFDTTMEDINALKNELQAFVLSKENSRDFLPEIDVEVTGIAEMNKLELAVEVRHKASHSIWACGPLCLGFAKIFGVSDALADLLPVELVQRDGSRNPPEQVHVCTRLGPSTYSHLRSWMWRCRAW